MAKFDIREIYVRVFGYKGLPFPEALLGLNADRSFFNRPFFMPLTLDGYRLPVEPMIDLAQSKNIIKTPVPKGSSQAKGGTIKELYGMGDYGLRIRGIIVGPDDDDYPDEIVRRLRTILEKGESLAIESRITTLFDISMISVDDFSIPYYTGAENVQPFEIRASSDRTVELEIQEGL